MAERIYTQNERGELAPLEEELFSSEDDLQALIAKYPELLDGKQIRPDDPRRWILVSREQGIAESSGSGDRWSLDHLIIDQDAVPTLIEVKRGSNPELRRTVVGQLLEYAAHAAQTWTANELRHTFENVSRTRGGNPDELLAGLLGADEEPDVEGFWETVATNLAARRLRLLFVADEIPDPLARVVEFLNAQMPHIEVLAVEIKQFRGAQFHALVPRVIGRTATGPDETGSRRRRKLTRELFFAELPSEEARTVAKRILAVADSAGATLAWGERSVSIRAKSSRPGPLLTVVWMCVTSKPGWAGVRDISFGTVWDQQSLEDEGLIPLEEWAKQFRADGFAEDISAGGAQLLWTAPYDVAAKHIDLLAGRLEKVLSELQAI